MIHVFFVPGMFGSTIEYVLRTFTEEFEPVDADIMQDGSMHSFKKQFHWLSIDDINETYNISTTSNDISTPIYPQEKHHFPEILEAMTPLFKPLDSKILVYADTPDSAELNILFQYYKIANGVSCNLGMSIFFNTIGSLAKQWNNSYNSWQDMQPWEIREWFSMFYPGWVKEWSNSVDLVDDSFLKVSNTYILNDPNQAINDIIDHCNLTVKDGISEFLSRWRAAQQYIIDEHLLLTKITNCTVEQQQFEWKPLNIISESIIQQNLQSMGFEIRCDGLNTFPTDSKTLYNLLEKV